MLFDSSKGMILINFARQSVITEQNSVSSGKLIVKMEPATLWLLGRMPSMRTGGINVVKGLYRTSLSIRSKKKTKWKKNSQCKNKHKDEFLANMSHEIGVH